MLAKQFRFHGYNSLRFTYSQGRTIRVKGLQLKTIHNPSRTESRLAVVVSKKITKKAPVRNRIRRRLYEAVRLHWAMLEVGHDMIISVFDENIADMPASQLNRQVVELLTKADLYKR